MAPPAAQAQLLLSNHPSPLLSPPQRRRLLGGPPPRSHTCAIRHHHGHDKCASSSSTRLRHALRPPAATAVAIAPGDHWGNWAFLLSAAAFGTWAEENTSWGAALSGALVSIMAGLAATAVGLVTPGAPAHDAVMEYLLPAAVPLLLLGADLRRVVRTTGDLLKAFLLGSVATVIGTTVAYLLIPMRSLGQDSWKIAAALMGSYIGGADNLISALYFMALFSLASNIPAEPKTATASPQKDGERLSVLNGGAAVALSFIICKAGSAMAARLGLQGGTLPCVTALAVFLATAFPAPLSRLAPAGETLALILMQLFFAVVGANGNVVDAVTRAPSVFAFALVQVSVHMAVVLAAGRVIGIDRKPLLIASNANIGGPTTAAAMATAKGWTSLVVPGILVGIFGISIATFLGIGYGMFVLRRIRG
ncbi:uncharacterized protein [Zea mays]|uniref:Membrane protein YjcL n=1 Tax=Zea mays TaxID=4577 RepID=C0HG93_MAIZE|nr:uncharacterized protein LOC100383377 isoform X1 [Zea mays]ACN26046.1 unknown [Zea mays]